MAKESLALLLAVAALLAGSFITESLVFWPVPKLLHGLIYHQHSSPEFYPAVSETRALEHRNQPNLLLLMLIWQAQAHKPMSC